MKIEQDLDKYMNAMFKMGEASGSHLLAEKMRVLLDALEAAEKAEKSPDNFIIMQIMREILTPYLTVEETQQ